MGGERGQETGPNCGGSWGREGSMAAKRKVAFFIEIFPF